MSTTVSKEMYFFFTCCSVLFEIVSCHSQLLLSTLDKADSTSFYIAILKITDEYPR